MLIIGLTGGIGSGKTTVAKHFAKLNVPIIDADKIAREVVAPSQIALKKIVDKFGPPILTTTGELDRKKLREIIFNNSLHRQWLEKLLHPLIRNEIHRRVSHLQADYVIIIIPLLFETHYQKFLDRIVVIDCDEALQIKRVRAREHCTASHVKKMMAAQVGRKLRLAKADDVITNDQDIALLPSQVETLHRKYLRLAKKIPPTPPFKIPPTPL